MSADLLVLLMRVVLVFSVAIAVVMALRVPMRGLFGARVAYGLWALVPIATIASLLPARLVIIDAPRVVASTTPAVADAPADEILTAPLASDLMISRADASPYIIALWALGFAISLALLVFAQRRFTARLSPQRRADGAHLAQSDSVGPAVVGVVMPRIVVPADFDARYTALERQLVLEHERAHIRAGDVQVNALAAFVQCVFWFNPLAYIARAALRIDQELACDERVMQRHAGSRRAYAEAMLKTQLAARALPLGCAWPPVGAKPLKQRITALARPNVGNGRRTIGAGVCFATACIVGVAAWIVQPPRHAYANEVEHQSLFAGASGARLVQVLMDGDVATARALIADGADVNHWTPGDGTPLIMAVRLEDIAMVNELIAAGADVDKAAHGEGNALIVAAARGNVDIMRILMRAGADVNATVEGDETPLINAAWRNRIEAARYLINHGADVNLAVRAPIVDGAELRSPLQMARRENHQEMIALLRAAGARN